MEVFVPKASHLVVLTFLCTAFLLGLGGLLLAYSLWRGNQALARKSLLASVAIVAGYLGLLLSNSAASKEIVLRANEWKYFCEVDCHLAYSVVSVATAKTLGSGASQARADGTFHVVTLKTWFDPDTISRHRGDGPLHPNLRMARVVDESGRRFATSLPGQKAIEAPAARMVPLDQTLRPGEFYETTLVFDLPDDAKSPKLLFTDPLPVNWVIIGHENSFFHKKVYFSMESAPLGTRAQN
jgi:hypothetical protein